MCRFYFIYCEVNVLVLFYLLWSDSVGFIHAEAFYLFIIIFFTFIHLADTFIQSEVTLNQAILFPWELLA